MIIPPLLFCEGRQSRREPHETSDIYGPHVTNPLIKQALYLYARDLLIATKVAFLAGELVRTGASRKPLARSFIPAPPGIEPLAKQWFGLPGCGFEPGIPDF
jgi:hypothetical protein